MKFKVLTLLFGLASCSTTRSNLVEKIKDCPFLVDRFEDEINTLYIAIPTGPESYVKFNLNDGYLTAPSGEHIRNYFFGLCSDIQKEIKNDLKPLN